MNPAKHLAAFFLFCLFLTASAFAQSNSRLLTEQCGTMPRLQQLLDRNPALKKRFELQQETFARMLSQRTLSPDQMLRTDAAVFIPVVFHVVLTNPAVVTDAQIQAQLDTLNEDFAGTNGDAWKVPSYFQPLFGHSKIRFCLAQRTPDGEPATGIVRTTTTKSSFGTDDAVKHTSSGGDDSWNTDKYFNVWLCNLSGGVLGYSTFPNEGSSNEQGVVIDYRSLPGGSATNYNGGKTLTHETGHYFNLYHIWGDDNGACTGTDYVDDTPNQGNSTTGCYSGIKTDACTPTGNGIMYQNYMDYSYDACLVMFTVEQVQRMESALTLYRASLLTSDGCQPVVRKAYDVLLKSINNPVQRLCSTTFTPAITIKNNGSQTLTSLSVYTQIDNGPVTPTAWTGSLTTAGTATINLTGLTTTTGQHLLTIYVSNPNATADQDNSNDTLHLAFQYYEPVTSVSESFEGATFPPLGWDVVNPDGGITWERATGVAKSGSSSVVIRNFENTAIGEKDDLRMPQASIPASVDSAFLSFQLAAATYTQIGTVNNIWDTLEVLVSTDCGQTYTSLYKKWGSSLVTHTAPETDEFIPSASEWRKDSINLAPYIGGSNLLFAFRNTTGNENDIYLDDVNLRTVTVNPNLKAAGFLVTPSPTSGQISVQFYPQPSDLRAIQIFNGTGQELAEVNISNGQANNLYNFDLSRYSAGVYYVRAVFANKVVIRKIVKL
jgi:hypothetical protein